MQLNTGRVVFWLGMPALFGAVMQLLIGGATSAVLTAVVTIMIGLFGFMLAGMFNGGSWLLLFYLLGNVLVPMYVKTLMGQPLDSNLRVPMESYLIVAVCTAELLCALVVVKHISVGKSLLHPISDVRTLNWLSWGCYWIGISAWFMTQYLQAASSAGVGGASLLQHLLPMAVIARTALLLKDDQKRWALDGTLVAMLASCVFLGLLTSHKTAAALPVVSYFATVMFYQRALAFRYIVVIAVAGTFFVGILAPMLHVWRSLGEADMPLVDRIALIADDAPVIFNGKALTRAKERAESVFSHGYYNYYGGGGRGQMLTGRYSSVQQIDPVIAEVDEQGERGGAVLWPALVRLVPAIVYPEKPAEGEAYRVLRGLGLIGPNAGKYPTLPLAGQVYAAYGWAGVLFVPFGVFTLFLVAFKKIGWQLQGNVFGIFFFCDFVIVYGHQGDFGQYLAAVLRNFPLLTVVFIGIMVASRRRWRWMPPSSRRTYVKGG